MLLSQRVEEYAIDNIDPELWNNANEVIRSAYGEFEVHSSEEGTAFYKTAVTILNEESKADHLYFPYSNHQKINKISIRIYDAFGKLIRKVKRTDIEDYSAITDYSIYDDNRYKYYRASHFSYPYTVEYEYEEKLTGIPFASFPNWYIQSSYYCSVESSVFKFKLPKGMNVHYRVLNIEDQIQKSQEKELTVLTWKFNDIPALVEEANMPLATDIFPSILTAPDHFKIDKFEGGMSSWEEFSAFIHKLFEEKDKLPETLVEEIKSMTRNAHTEKEKIDILYDYLQKNYRYVSVQLDIGGWQPFDAEYVYRNKYGDCKALTNFMAAMLKVVGIESRPALISNGNLFYRVSEDFTIAVFNHVILYVPSQDYWLECTSNRYPPNYIGSGNANRQALLIQAQKGRLIKTPSLTFKENIREGKTIIEFRGDGSADIKTNITTRGSKHEIFRAIESELTETEIRKWLENETAIPSVNFKFFNLTSADNIPESSFTYEAESRRYGAIAGKRIFLPLNVINNYKNIPPEQQRRKYPIELRKGFVEVDTIIFQLPQGYAVESIPVDEVVVDTDFGNFRMKVKQDRDQLIVFRRLEVRRAQLAPELYADYRNFFKLVAKADSHKAVLIKKRV